MYDSVNINEEQE